jgi:hypothetical protein
LGGWHIRDGFLIATAARYRGMQCFSRDFPMNRDFPDSHVRRIQRAAVMLDVDNELILNSFMS